MTGVAIGNATGTYPFATALRTHLCGGLRLDDSGALVRLGGWVNRRRDLGGLIFVDLRDRSGMVQVRIDPVRSGPALAAAAAGLGTESVVLVTGEVVPRPPDQRNPELATGDIEVLASELRVVGPAETPAIPVSRAPGEALPAEEQRLRHRYLDLRRPEMQRNLLLRHRLLQAARAYLAGAGFIEIETPILTKPTPEGARDYLVPSRVHPGEFYALPQSPQLYKQLLMISGFDRYFQIARCFRDEDLRADRQPEFTQIDIEASFIGQEDVLTLTEGLLAHLWGEAGIRISTPFPRMAYAEAMERYGTDRPDLRYGLELADATDLVRDAEVPFIRAALAANGRARAIRLPGGGSLSRKQVDALEATARGAGVGGLLRAKLEGAALTGPGAKHLAPGTAERLALVEGDLVLIAAGPDRVTSVALDRVRQEAARLLGLVPADARRFLWVTDFPLFERDAATGALGAVHHPFTAPSAEDAAELDATPERVRAAAFDVVLNGTEMGGGSLRNADPAVQRRIFALLGIDEVTAEQRFGFLLEGLRAGAPPHGGIALGFDRIVMLLAGTSSLRDVIAFPKTTAARALFEGAPAPVTADDLDALHLRVEGALPHDG